MPRLSQERALLALVDHAQQDLWVVNRQGYITTLNDAHCRRWQQAVGITPEPGMLWVKLLPAGFQPQWQAYFDRALAGDRLSVQFRGGFPGSIGLLELRMTPIFREPSANDERLEAGLREAGLLEAVLPEAVAVSLQEADLPTPQSLDLKPHERRYPLPWQTLAQALPGGVNWVHEDRETGASCWVAMLAVPPTLHAASLLPELQEHPDLALFLTRFLVSAEASPADGATCPTLDLQLDRGGGDRPIYQLSAQRPLGYPFVLLTVLDVTAQRKLEQLLQESRESYFLAVQGANDGVWDWNLQTNLIYFSPRWKELLGYEDTAIESDPEEWFSRVHPEERHALQQKIHAHLEGLSQYFELEHRVMGSSGEQTAEDLLRKADTAMYRAKLRGRDRYELFETTMQVSSIRLLQLEIDRRRAIASPRYPAIPQQFQMQYQPIVCLNSGQITSMEALVRWHHPKRGLISPIKFIPIAEETGLIIPLGEWILAETFQQHRRWQTQLPSQCLPSISVNLSTRQFKQVSLTKSV